VAHLSKGGCGIRQNALELRVHRRDLPWRHAEILGVLVSVQDRVALVLIQSYCSKPGPGDRSTDKRDGLKNRCGTASNDPEGLAARLSHGVQLFVAVAYPCRECGEVLTGMMKFERKALGCRRPFCHALFQAIAELAEAFLGNFDLLVHLVERLRDLLRRRMELFELGKKLLELFFVNIDINDRTKAHGCLPNSWISDSTLRNRYCCASANAPSIPHSFAQNVTISGRCVARLRQAQTMLWPFS
jgi:hypothetical protein